MKTKFSLLLIPLLFACFALSPSIQAAPLNVNVLNTPTVNVATMPPVLIDSSATNYPVLVKDVDNPARQPFTFFSANQSPFSAPVALTFKCRQASGSSSNRSRSDRRRCTDLKVQVQTIFPAGQSN